jgi:hypothetical protein
MNKIIVKVIFYGLIIGATFAASALYFKNIGFEKTTINNNYPAIMKVDTNTPAISPPAAQTCIITIDGKKYDVQPLRDTHTGGDIFQCGTDMSDVFHNQHGDNLRMIQKYLVP